MTISAYFTVTELYNKTPLLPDIDDMNTITGS